MSCSVCSTSRPRSLYRLALLTSCYVFGELGHFLIGVTSRDVARDVHYGDSECFGNGTCSQAKDEATCVGRPGCSWDYTGLGLEYQLLVGPAFIAVFTVAGVALGAAADVAGKRGKRALPRTALLGAAVLVFSCATAAVAAATRYWHLVALRILLAAGEAACSPLGVSLISDLFPVESRGAATGIFHWGIYFGYGASYLLGVYVTKLDLLGLGWRACYLLAGLPGLVVAVLLMLEPDEARQETKEDKEAEEMKFLGKAEKEGGLLLQVATLPPEQPPNRDVASVPKWLRVLRVLFLDPAMVLLFVAAAVRHSAGFTFAYNARLYYLTYYPEADVGSWLSWIPIVGGSAGVYFGGTMSDWMLSRFNKEDGASSGARPRLWVLSCSLLLASPFAVGAIVLEPPWAFVSVLTYYFFSETWLGIVFVVVVELVPADVKTAVLGAFLFLMNNVGGNLPVLVDPLTKATESYRAALALFFPTFVFASGLIFLAASLVLKKKPSNVKKAETNSQSERI